MMSRICTLALVAAICGCTQEKQQNVPAQSAAEAVHDKADGPVENPAAGSLSAATASQEQTGRRGVVTAAKPAQPADVSTRIAENQKQNSLKNIFGGAATTAINGDGRDRLRADLLPVRDLLTAIEISDQPNSHKWNHVKLNQFGKWFDAVRFHTPPGGRSDLYLSFCCAGVVQRWNVLDFSSPRRALNEHQVEWNAKVEGLAAPVENRLILYSDSRGFEPDTDYCLWFLFENAEEREADVAATLLPHNESRSAATSAEIAALMGIAYRLPQFVADPAGAKQALEFARSLWNRRAGGSDRFRQVLSSVATALPELKVGQDGRIAWNEIIVNRSGVGFDAYRFRCPMDGPADLHYVIAEPQDQDMGYGVSSLEGFRQGGRFHLEIDLQLAGVSLPPQNVTFFELMPFGQFSSGQDYVFWITSEGEKQEQTSLGMLFSTPTPPPQPVTSAALATDAGIELPETIEASRIDAARRKCRVWCLQRGSLENNLLRCGLQSVVKALPEIQVTSGTQPLSWNTVRLNADGVGFDAVRFKSPVDHRAEFYCTFADSRNLRWQLVSAEGNDGRVDNIYQMPAAGYEIAGAAPTSQLTVASDSWNQVNRMIEPGREYILWFLSPDGATPRDLKLAVHLLPRTTPVWFKTAAEIATRIGLKPASGPARAGNVLLGKHPQGVVDLAFTPDGRLLASIDRSGNLRLWNMESLPQAVAFKVDGDHFAACLRISPDGKTVALGLTEPAEIVVWDIESQQIASRIPMKDLNLLDLAFSPDGQRLAVSLQGEKRGTIFPSSISVWDLNSKIRVQSKSIDGPRFGRLAWPADNRLVAVGFQLKKIEGPANFGAAAAFVWNPETLELVAEAHDPLSAFDDLSVAGTPQIVAASGNPRILKLWNLEMFEALPPLPLFGNPGTPHSLPGRVALSANGRFAALSTIGWDLQYWDLASRRMLFMRPAHEGEIGRIAISPDGNWIASCGKDQVVQLWDTRFPASTAVQNSLGMRFVRIPAGSFAMGSPDKEQGRDPQREAPQHEVRVSHDILMGIHEVTLAQFRQFVEATGYKTTAETNGSGGSHIFELAKGFESRPELTWRSPGFPQDDNHPVVQISWDDANAFCRWLTTKEKVSYRLPTEAEWEYACRAGTKGEYFYNDGAYFLSSVANFADQAILRAFREYSLAASNQDDRFAYTAPVGSYAANAFGLYDTHGNVWEWCHDWFDAHYYAASPEQDPQGPATGKNRVVRGGSFQNGYWQCRSGCRDFELPNAPQSSTGFRVVREIDE